MSAIKKVPIGIEGFKKLIDKNCYIDKSDDQSLRRTLVEKFQTRLI